MDGASLLLKETWLSPIEVLIKPDRGVGEFLHISIQLINNMMWNNEKKIK